MSISINDDTRDHGRNTRFCFKVRWAHRFRAKSFRSADESMPIYSEWILKERHNRETHVKACALPAILALP